MTIAQRVLLADFALANPLYANARVWVYDADVSTGSATTAKATLYRAPTGTDEESNPFTLDSTGKLQRAVYVDTPVVARVTDALVQSHDTGVIGFMPRFREEWEEGAVYQVGDVARDGDAGNGTGYLYFCLEAHTAGASFDADLTDAKWTLYLTGSASSSSRRVDALSYGATGDGSTDDSTALQAWLNAAASAGWVAYLPAGIYIATSLTAPAGLKKILGDGNDVTTIKRPASAPSSASILSATAVSDLTVSDICFDGNKANQTLGSNALSFSAGYEFRLERVRCINSKAAAGFGAGIVLSLTPSTNATGREVAIIDCESYDNDDAGLSILQTGAGITVSGGVYSNNTGDGVSYYDQAITPAADTVPNMRIAGVRAERNGGAGITLRGFFVAGLGGVRTYGHGSDPMHGPSVTGCQANYNASYGIFTDCTGTSVIGNTTRGNGTASHAGICANAESITISGNVVIDNLDYGIDAGGMLYGAITDNQVRGTGDPGTAGTGINLGACQHVICRGNVLVDNGLVEIYVPRNDAGSNYFPWDAVDIQIAGNTIVNTLSAARFGILTVGLPDEIWITDNRITWPDADGFTAIRGGITSGVIRGNTLNAQVARPNNAAASISLPDWVDALNINTDTAPIVALLSVSQASGIQKLLACVMTDRGSGYSADFDVIVTGGGGSGAAVRAKVTQDGRVAAAIVTDQGTGYSSVPTLDFSNGDGTGAAATAKVGAPLFPGKDLRLMAFGSDFRLTAGSALLPSYNGATLTIANRGSITLRSLEDRWYPTSIESGNGWHYYADGRVDAAGSGTPEGALAAPIGSTWRRSDGGASTSFYVKESGAGNAGWVAK